LLGTVTNIWQKFCICLRRVYVRS